MSTQLTDPAFLTTAETASLLRVSPRTICRYAAEGRLAAVYLTARSLRFPAASVQALMEGADTPDLPLPRRPSHARPCY